MFNFSALLASAAVAKLLPAILVAVLGIVLIRLVLKALAVALEKSHLEKAAHSLIRSVSQVGLFALLAFIVAGQLGIDLTSVIAIASVATLAVSLALQTAVSNVVGGLTLLSNHPFVSGDFVEIAGQSGTVLEVGMTYTKLQTPDNKIISLPNSAIMGAQITNYSVSGKRRVDLTISASYDDDVNVVLSALKEVGDQPCTLKEEDVFVGVTEYGDSAISYVVRFWVKTGDYWTAYFEGQRRMTEVFKAHGLTMTYPHLNVHIDNK